MPDLIISEITLMGRGYCVIGLDRIQAESFRSVRPLPPQAFAWREPFPFRRGDRVRFSAVPMAVSPPHVEDQKSRGLLRAGPSASEDELIGCLRKAEVANSLHDLFGCRVQMSDRGGRALWVNPCEAMRSICGCEYENLRLRIFPEAEGFALRAEAVMNSGERMSSIPIVDREWHRFVVQLTKRIRRADRLSFAERFLNRSVADKMLLSLQRFARIGLPRPRNDQQCWLMLDSLFPQPKEAWLDLL